MELDISMGNNSLSIPVENPFQLDMNSILEKIEDFLASNGASMNGMDIAGLLPEMVRGIAGCEKGCPSNAKSLVSRGYGNFEIQYIEGGILSARTQAGNGKIFYLKMFPDFS